MTPEERKAARLKCSMTFTEAKAYAEAGILKMVNEEYDLLRKALDALDARDALLRECLEMIEIHTGDGDETGVSAREIESKIREVLDGTR